LQPQGLYRLESISYSGSIETQQGAQVVAKAKEFIIEYEFSSTRAYGDAYKRRLIVKAHDEKGALSIAKIEGFRAFDRFNDNCTDWNIVRK
jgi:hypothetical protein